MSFCCEKKKNNKFSMSLEEYITAASLEQFPPHKRFIGNLEGDEVSAYMEVLIEAFRKSCHAFLKSSFENYLKHGRGVMYFLFTKDQSLCKPRIDRFRYLWPQGHGNEILELFPSSYLPLMSTYDPEDTFVLWLHIDTTQHDEPTFVSAVVPIQVQRVEIPRCGFIGCTKEGTKRCSRCKKIHYCSADHQRKHWQLHKALCYKVTKS